MTSNHNVDAVNLSNVSILVVEDAWHVAKAMKGLLGSIGMNVMGPVATTVDARRLLASQRPQLALVDINLRGEPAWDLIDDLHKQDVQVLIMSGYPLLNDPAGNPITCLQKPCDATEILDAINAIVAKQASIEQ